MMIIMQFTFQIILLAVGFGVGYFLLVHAGTQQGAIKSIGQTLGGILIIMAMILAIFSCYYSMKIASRASMQGSCPIQKMMNQQEAPIMDNGAAGDDEDTEGYQATRKNSVDENQADASDIPQIDKDRPVKGDIKDHE